MQDSSTPQCLGCAAVSFADYHPPSHPRLQLLVGASLAGNRVSLACRCTARNGTQVGAWLTARVGVGRRILGGLVDIMTLEEIVGL